jgi:hypothetical protein
VKTSLFLISFVVLDAKGGDEVLSIYLFMSSLFLSRIVM